MPQTHFRRSAYIAYKDRGPSTENDIIHGGASPPTATVRLTSSGSRVVVATRLAAWTPGGPVFPGRVVNVAPAGPHRQTDDEAARRRPLSYHGHTAAQRPHALTPQRMHDSSPLAPADACNSCRCAAFPSRFPPVWSLGLCRASRDGLCPSRPNGVLAWCMVSRMRGCSRLPIGVFGHQTQRAEVCRPAHFSRATA